MATILTAVVVFVLDQLSKCWIRAAIPEGGSVAVFQRFFNVTHVRNRGGAFGIFPHQQYLFIFLSLVTIAAIAYFYWGYEPKRKGCKIAVGLVLGGAVGNLMDRMFLDKEGCVTDWLDVYWGSWHWPAFNVADAAITVGVFMLLYILTVRAEVGATGDGT
jgi:signal peptidase II